MSLNRFEAGSSLPSTQAVAAGLVAREAATRLQEKIAERRKQQNSEQDRRVPRSNLEDWEVEETQRRTCWTEMPNHPVCRELPAEYSFASLRMEDAQQCIAELVNALSWAIMTEKVEHWGSRHPKEWALWYQLVWRDDDDPRKTNIMIAMAGDPDVKRLARAGWLEVAVRLEAALRETAGSSEGSGPHT